jgi:hypothetical protein
VIRWRSIGAAMAGLVGLALVAIVAGVVFGVTIDASRWRDTAAQKLSAALGRPVVRPIRELRRVRNPMRWGSIAETDANARPSLVRVPM